MKNKREIILDFTSLLDVIMLILFFFVIFAQIDSTEAMTKIEEIKRQSELQMSKAQAEWEKVNDAEQQLNSELEQLQNSNTLAESIIINSDSEFDKALRLKLILARNQSDKWILSLESPTHQKDEYIYTELGKIDDVREIDSSKLADAINTAIINNDYSNEDAFICDIMFDSSEPGSNKSKRNLDEAIKILQNDFKYQYLFISVTDLSYMEGLL